eukprot:NODE_1830_length_1288_cov_4.591606_g1514_i0.p5 GENE.NODE_1830_length_1288_cov_4.591606_g1514_i0~~NODE_1830_length_1288_cov_4.591606_g1514_i0.p5  ORF type:complete len:72 (-),score=4.43 NODE_1830_length_1288_cov_4.591606_g1514_i0:993-1208(-)
MVKMTIFGPFFAKTSPDFPTQTGDAFWRQKRRRQSGSKKSGDVLEKRRRIFSTPTRDVFLSPKKRGFRDQI